MKKLTINSTFLVVWLVPFVIFCIHNTDMTALKGLFNNYTWTITKFTFFQAFVSSLIALAISIIPAHYISKSNSFISLLAECTIFIPFFFPAVSTVVAFSIIGNLPALRSLGILYTLGIIIIANVFYNAPIFTKYIGEALGNIPISILENASLEGAGSIRTFFSIKLPIVLPSVFKAFFICFVFCFTGFAIILGLGGIKFSTLEVEIATTLSSSMDLSKALGYGIIQFIILSILSLGSTATKVYENSNAEKKQCRTGYISFSFTIIYLCFEYTVVLIGLVFAFYNFYTDRFDFSGIINLFSAELNTFYPVLLSIFNSFVLSLITALFVLIFVYLILKNHSRYTDWIVLSACGISNAFLGIVLVYMNIRYSISYPVLVVCGYLIIASPFAYSFMYQHIKGFSLDLIEASKIDGASAFQIFKHIELPILLPVFITVFAQVFAIAFGEFTIAYTMQLLNYFPTLPVVDYVLLSNRKIMESSILNGISILIIALVFILSEVLRRICRNKFN